MTEKLLTLLHIYGGAMKIGGHYRSGLAMAKGLIERGHRVIVVAPDAVTEMVTAFQQAGAEFKLLPVVGKVSKLPCLSGWKCISDIVERHKVDVIHSIDYANVARGYRAAIETGKAFICTEAGANSVSHFPPRKARVVIFSDEQMAIYRNLYRLPEGSIRLIKARIDTDFYHPEPVPQDFINNYDLARDGLAVGIVCRLDIDKNHIIRALIDFVKDYKRPDRKINIYVVGDGGLRATLQEQAEQVNNPYARISFVGPIYDTKQVNWFYNYCDVVIGSGRGIMEAMACKKPVIIPSENGQAEIIGADNSKDVAYYNFSGRHFRTKTNAANLSSALSQLLDIPGKRQVCSEFCYDYIKNHLSAQIGVEQLIDWYRADRVESKMSDFLFWYLEASYWIVKTSLKYKFLHLFMKKVKIIPI
jgi:glycosyltransferase involved in cell wall biosynthesis